MPCASRGDTLCERSTYALIARSQIGLATRFCGYGLGRCQCSPGLLRFDAGKADASLSNEASQVAMVREGKRTVISMLNDYDAHTMSLLCLCLPPRCYCKGRCAWQTKRFLTGQTSIRSRTQRNILTLTLSLSLVRCPLSFDWGRDRRRYGDAKKSLVEAAVAPAPVAARSTIRNKAVGVTVKTQGVTVETQHTLKEYGSIGLSATQPDGLEIWLAENG